MPEDIFNQMKCCLCDDGHIVVEPVFLKCCFNACKKCITNSTVALIPCFGCNNTHEKKELKRIIFQMQICQCIKERRLKKIKI